MTNLSAHTAFSSASCQLFSSAALFIALLASASGMVQAFTEQADTNFSVKNQTPLSSPLAIATWVERDGKSFVIKGATLVAAKKPNQDPVWSEPVPLHSSEHALTSTSVVTLSDSTQLLFWAELEKGKRSPNAMSSSGNSKSKSRKASIRYKTKAAGAQKWGEPMTLHDKGHENIGVSLLRWESQIWAFWASTDADLPDIKYRIFSGGSWSKAELVHPRNQVPDLAPRAAITDQGELVLNWLSYSFLQDDYITAEKVMADKLDTSGMIDIINTENFAAPIFLPSNRAVTIRFPRNQFNQSVKTVNGPVKNQE